MANLQFWRSNQMSDTSFLDLVKRTFGKTFTKGIDAKNWLITNGYYTSYPDIVTDGLVLNLDAANLSSFKGEPTTNLNTYTLSSSTTDGSGQGSIGVRTILSPNHVRIVDNNSNTRQFHDINGLVGGTIYTVSIEYMKISGTPTFRFQLQNNLNGVYQSTIKFTNTTEIGITDRAGWQVASWTFTLGVGMNGMRIWYQDGEDYTTYTHSFELRNPQLEQKSYATPYVNGTRGTTFATGGGWCDLSGNGNHFDSPTTTNILGGITFYGNTIIKGNHSPESTDGNYSFETWINMKTPDGTYENIISNQSQLIFLSIYNGAFSNDHNLYFVNRTDGGTWNSIQYNFTDYNKYVNIVCTRSGQTLTIYQDATLKYTQTFSNLSNTINAWSLGDLYSGTSGAMFNGDISIFKTYNKALSQSEITQNFNANRERFGL